MKNLQAAMLMAVVAVSLTGCNSEVEQAVRHELIDGESAKFRDIQRCSGDTKVSRGEVNAKNRMGAYTGFEPFYYDGVSVAFLSSPGFEGMMNRCYADVAKNISAASDSTEATSQPVDSSNWMSSEDANPVDDSKTYRTTILASEGASSSGDAVSLSIRCQSKRTELFVTWHDYLGDDSNDVYEDWKNVTVRVGSNPARNERWSISTDNEATFAPSPTIELIRNMVRTKRLVLQTTPYNENPITAVFNLDGIEKAVLPIANGCGWQL